jgi:hypothetical protein
MTNDFFRGFIAMGFLVASAFFLRFWRETRDRLFAYFSSAFFLLAIHRPILVLFGEEGEHSLWPYMIRLLAYLVILIAIIDKNLRQN